MSTLVVWMATRRVGELIQKPNGNLQFRYDPDYDGPPVSQALPRQGDAHPHKPVRAVFGGLLPEGDVRAALARNLGISGGNDYGLLEEVGGDVAGAISLLPVGVEPPGSADVDGTADELRRADHAHPQARARALRGPRRQRGVSAWSSRAAARCLSQGSRRR